MQCLCAHSQNEQENIVKFCIRQAQRVKLVSKQHISILQDQHLKGKIQKKENSLRRKIEKNVLQKRKWSYQMSFQISQNVKRM